LITEVPSVMDREYVLLYFYKDVMFIVRDVIIHKHGL